MSRTGRIGSLALACLIALGAPVAAQDWATFDRGGAPGLLARDGDKGIGGTGVSGDDKGIGGTGVIAGDENQDRGIGGTGIVGIVTGFGSILVNGMEIELDDYVAVSGLDGPVRPDALRIGHLVAVEAVPGADGRLHARDIELHYPVAGPVEAIDRASARVRVMGQWVTVGDDTATGLTDRSDPLDGIFVGSPLRVSGLRRGDGTVVASRIDPHPAGAPAQLRGIVTSAGRGSLAVEGVPVRGALPPGLQPGDTVVLSGRPDGNGLRAERIARLPDHPFGGRVGALSLQGFPRTVPGRGLRLQGMPFDARGLDSAGPVGSRPLILDGAVGRDRQFRQRELRPSVPGTPGLSRGAAPNRGPAAVTPRASGRPGAPRTRQRSQPGRDDRGFGPRRDRYDDRPGLGPRGRFDRGGPPRRRPGRVR